MKNRRPFNTNWRMDRPPKKEIMDYPEFAYTGPTPATGLVGFINIKETDTGILFTVRREGDDKLDLG